jgi:hypothetical protein
LDDLDALAASLDRPRSWVVAEAVRRYVAVQRHAASEGLDPQRREQLRRDLALSPVARVRAAEEPLRVGLSEGAATTPVRIFATYDDFAAWRRRHAQP